MDTNRPKHIVALSGGKDSTAMALMLKKLYPQRRFEFVITPTGDELPEMEAHWRSLEKMLGGLIKINVISLLELIKKEGMIPNFRARFCTRILKVEPILEYLSRQPEGSVCYVGLRADEPNRIGIIDKKYKSVFPLRKWGWGIDHVKRFNESLGINIPARTDCGCCFYQRLDEWHNLLKLHPKRYKAYEKLESEIGHTFRSPSRDTWPADLKSLRKEFERGRKLIRRKRQPERCRFCSM